jgi:hypothetical protein
MANPPPATARTKPVRAIVIITVQVLRPIGATQARATRAPSRVVTITAGVGHLTTAAHQVGIGLLMTIAVNLPCVIMVTSVRAIEASPRTNPIRAANLPVVTIIVRVGRRIAGTHRVMIMIAVRCVMANTRVVRMQHRVGVSQVIVLPTSLVLARSRRVAIIAVRDGHLTGVDLPAMAMISVIQVQATTTGSRPNPLGFPPRMALNLMMMLNSMSGHLLGRRTTSRVTPRLLSRPSLDLVGIRAQAFLGLPRMGQLGLPRTLRRLRRRKRMKPANHHMCATSLDLVGIGAEAVRELPQKNHLL